MREPAPGEINHWIAAHFPEGAPGSPQREFRMLLVMHLHHGVSAEEAIALASESVRRRHPSFVPDTTER
jgi:hypothetical protein